MRNPIRQTLLFFAISYPDFGINRDTMGKIGRQRDCKSEGLPTD